jgi:hypothetical protein
MDKRILEKNIAALKALDPAAAALILECAPAGPDRAVLETTRKGLPTLKVMCADGVAVYLHSHVDPAAEAEKKVSALDLIAGEIPVVVGCGLGYLPLSLARKLEPDRLLVLLEPDPELLRTAMETLDLTPLLERRPLLIIVSSDPGEVGRRLKDELPMVVEPRPKIIPIASNPGRIYGDTKMQSLLEAVGDAFSSSALSHRSLRLIGEMLVFNQIANLPAILNSPGVGRLRDAWKGRPAVLVAPGPSASELLPELSANHGKLLIIAVDTAMKPLLAAGAPPHAVLTVDPLSANMAKFEGLPPLGAALVFTTEAIPAAVKGWSGPRVCFGHHGPFFDYFSPMPEKGILDGCGTVSSNALSLAFLLGADPVFLVGFDLGFPDGTRYIAGTWAEGKGLPPPKSELDVESAAGGRIATWKVFADQIQWMREQIGGRRARVINTSRTGARIPGTAPGGPGDIAAAAAAATCPPPSADVFAAEPDVADDEIKERMLGLLDSEIRDIGHLEKRIKKMISRHEAGSLTSGTGLDQLSRDIDARRYLSDALVARFSGREKRGAAENLREMAGLLSAVRAAFILARSES